MTCKTLTASSGVVLVFAALALLAPGVAVAERMGYVYWPETHANHRLLGYRLVDQSDVAQARANLAFYLKQCNELKASGAPAYDSNAECGSGSPFQDAENHVSATLKGLPIINADCTGVAPRTTDFRYRRFRCVVFTRGYSPTSPPHFWSSRLNPQRSYKQCLRRNRR
jgi:hypothetical protein